ncbi:MAG: hypothetical protein U0231_06925 [Nitrospiraceae bacterium]
MKPLCNQVTGSPSTHATTFLLQSEMLREQQQLTLRLHRVYVLQETKFNQVRVDRDTPSARLVLESSASAWIRRNVETVQALFVLDVREGKIGNFFAPSTSEKEKQGQPVPSGGSHLSMFPILQLPPVLAACEHRLDVSIRECLSLLRFDALVGQAVKPDWFQSIFLR